MSRMLEEEWAGMNEWVPSRRRDWLWDSIRWMMAELDRWPPQSTPPLARWLDTRLHHDGVVWDLVLHGMAWHGHGNLGPCEGNQPPT